MFVQCSEENYIALSRIENWHSGAPFIFCLQSLAVTCSCISPAILSPTNVIIYWRLLTFYTLCSALINKNPFPPYNVYSMGSGVVVHLVNNIVWGRSTAFREFVLCSDERTCVPSMCSGFCSWTQCYLQRSHFQVVTSKMYCL